MNHSVSTMTGKVKIKIAFLGNQNVGKTCIIDQYINDRFEEAVNPTVGIDFLAKNVILNAKTYRLQLWDTAGQERFRSLIPSYLKDARCALVIFDVTLKSSFADVSMWIKMYRENAGGEGVIILVGNKIDRQFRQVSKQQAIAKATQLCLPYIQISAKTGQSIDELFTTLIQNFGQKSTGDLPHKTLQFKRQSNKQSIQSVKEEKDEQQETNNKLVAIQQPSGKTKKQQNNPKSNNITIAQVNQNITSNIVLKNEKKSPQEGNRRANCC